MENELSKLLLKIQSGDKEAFREVYKMYFKQIYRYCRIQLSNDVLAADACQDVFIKAWKALPNFTFTETGTFKAFLYRIARNHIIDLSRKKKEFPLHEYEEIETDDNVIENLSKQDTMQLIKKTLQQMDEKDRQIIILRYFEDMSTEETAKVIGISHGNLRVKIHRVLKKMKDILEQYEN